MSGNGGNLVKRGDEAINCLAQMLKGALITECKRDGAALVITLQGGVQVAFEAWGECVLPVQVKMGVDSKPYYEGTFSKTDGLVLFEKALF